MKHTSKHLAQQRSPLRMLALTSLLVASCGHSTSHPVPAAPSSPVYEEIEPNNDPLFGDFIGWVDRGTHLFVVGEVDDDPGPWGDIYDNFEFVTDAPASFEVRLESDSAWNDVALGVFDPDTGEMVLWVDDPSGFNWADFTVHEANKSFVLVVAATWGYGSYELELLGHSYAPLSPAPGARSSAPRPVIEVNFPLDPYESALVPTVEISQ